MQPRDYEPEVYIKKSKERRVLVKRFGGYVMEDSVWLRHATQFKAQLKAENRMDELEQDFFYTAGYDGPRKVQNRRNEVMFELRNNSNPLSLLARLLGLVLEWLVNVIRMPQSWSSGFDNVSAQPILRNGKY